MGLFFAGKVEKALSRCVKKESEILVRYIDSSHYHKSKVVRVDPDKFLFLGFTNNLREDIVEVRIPDQNLSCEVKITHISQDLKGNVLFHSPHPADFHACYKVDERHFVYPRVKLGLAWETPEGTKKLEQFVWDISHTTLEFVHSSEEVFLQGHKFQAKVQAGKTTLMTDLEVRYQTSKQFGRQNLILIGCDLKSPDEHLEEAIEVCARIDE